ncbi:hypothetical protein [Halalkalicoccus tibetensis]|uniref:Uncharacterized protein n=1 Tax=Halalkalicoccus tibetensis TaxID=175632 RepID=A0ABD5VAY3_9EURY
MSGTDQRASSDQHPNMRERPSAHRPTLTEDQREAVYDRYDEWLRSPSAGSKRCHLPAVEPNGDGDGDGDHPTPICGVHVADDRGWRAKDPACFPGK